MTTDKIKVAVIHDWLNGMRGGEKVLEEILDLFPAADVFTLFLEEDKISQKIKNHQIFTSDLNKYPLVRKRYKSFLQFLPGQIERFDLRAYQLVISTSHCVAKGIIPAPDAVHISYVHSPMRYIWDQHYDYFPPGGGLKNWYIRRQCHKLRVWDVTSSSRVDYFISNSNYIKKRIQKYYHRDAEVIHPPVETDMFIPGKDPVSLDGYFLTVSALVPYKRVDLTIQAFNKSGEQLIVVGKGSEEKRLKKIAKGNIVFKKNISQAELIELYRQASGYIFNGVEDFGISFVEAQACGVPVLAYRRGGVLDIVTPQTGILFEDQDVTSTIHALKEFKRKTFDRQIIRKNALRFSKDVFKTELNKFILDKLHD